jgi:hypothetical protein
VDLENIVKGELKLFFGQRDRVAHHLKDADRNLVEKSAALEVHRREVQKVQDEMTRTHRLYLDGGITSQGFGEFYKPAEKRLNQLRAELPKPEAEVDLLKVNKLSADAVFPYHQDLALLTSRDVDRIKAVGLFTDPFDGFFSLDSPISS